MDLEALELVPEGVVIIDPDGTIAHANRRARVLLGLTGDAVGKPLRDGVHAVDASGEPLGELVAPNPVADRLAEQVVRVQLPDGRVRPVAVSGRFVGARTVLTFRHAARRERLDSLRSDLVATVSHEIRSPLTSVKGFTRTLLTRWERFGDEQKRAMLETVNADADRVTRLLKELLDVSRIDAGRVELQRQPVEIGAVIDAIVERVRHRPGGSDRDVTVDVGDVPAIMADPDKVEQIITNLVDNALTHAPGSPVHISARQVGDDARVSVADRGPGIPAEQRRRIFEKFGRGRGERRSGTGLGLYITRGLARAHGGDVWCESSDGGGATFHVRLPVDDPARPWEA